MQNRGDVQMLYQSPAEFCAEYASAPSHDEASAPSHGAADVFGEKSTLDTITVVSETLDTARVEALWYTFGHEPDSGYYDVFERFSFILVKRHDGWCLHSAENLGYE